MFSSCAAISHIFRNALRSKVSLFKQIFNVHLWLLSDAAAVSTVAEVDSAGAVGVAVAGGVGAAAAGFSFGTEELLEPMAFLRLANILSRSASPAVTSRLTPE